jgi:50S ribosomal protein L16 3-hydroxylase
MIAKIERVLGTISWTRRDVAEFLGTYLTEPKAHSPVRAAAQPAF